MLKAVGARCEAWANCRTLHAGNKNCGGRERVSRINVVQLGLASLFAESALQDFAISELDVLRLDLPSSSFHLKRKTL